MIDLTDAYVLGVLAEVGRQLPRAQEAMTRAEGRAKAIDIELGHAAQRLTEAKAAATEQEEARANMVRTVTAANARIAKLHDEINTLKKKSAEMQQSMEHADPAAVADLRRQRGRLAGQIDNRIAEIQKLGQEAEAQRKAYQDAYDTLMAARDRQRILTKEVNTLQSKLPEPVLYTRLFEFTVADAHCRFSLDEDAVRWCDSMRAAVDPILHLHQAIRAGRYRLDKHSDVVGGRALATADAVCAAVVLNDFALAENLFVTATDPNLFFHHIYSVFRVWCVGCYVTHQWEQLTDLVSLHRFADGERGALSQCFLALMAHDEVAFQSALRDLVRYNWHAAQDPKVTRGLGVVDITAAALVRLAHQAGMHTENPGPTVPDALYRLVSYEDTARGGLP